VEATRTLTPARESASARLLRTSADRDFEKLYRRHAREIYQYTLALLANPADAEDAAQTTFLNAYQALRRGEHPLHPRNWLIAIAHNVCRMRWRQAGHRPREVALEDVQEPVALEREQASLDEVLRALGRLSFNQRAALVMRELEGRSCREIGETLGLSVSAVEALLFRARRGLRLHRRALGALVNAPLPAKLASSLGLGAGGTTAGGAAIGADLLLKAAALVAVATTAGAVAVASPARHRNSAPARIAASVQLFRPPATPTRRARSAANVRTRRQIHRTHRRQGLPGARPVDAADTTQPAQELSASVPWLPQFPVNLPAVPPVTVPALPAVPALPVSIPALPPIPPIPPIP